MSAGRVPEGDVTIRPARVDDAAEISALIVATLESSNAADYGPAVIARVAAGFSPAGVAAMMARRRVLAACAGGRILGTAALEGATVRSVFVLPSHQGLGIGRALMSDILRLAGEEGIEGLSLRSSLTAQGFYRGLGFEAVEALAHGDEVTILMRRGGTFPTRT